MCSGVDDRPLTMTSTSPNPGQAASAVRPQGSAVLHLDPPYVELGWLQDGELQYRCVEVAGSDNELLVAATVGLVREAGLARSGVTVCLGAPFFDRRQVLLAPVHHPLNHVGHTDAQGRIVARLRGRLPDLQELEGAVQRLQRR